MGRSEKMLDRDCGQVDTDRGKLRRGACSNHYEDLAPMLAGERRLYKLCRFVPIYTARSSCVTAPFA
jgi:hypothetical protein